MHAGIYIYFSGTCMEIELAKILEITVGYILWSLETKAHKINGEYNYTAYTYVYAHKVANH